MFNNETGTMEYRVQSATTYFQSKGIPVDKWNGFERTKTIQDLLAEIDAGETTVDEDEKGNPVRNVFVVAGDIYSTDPISGKKVRLIELVQVFKQDSKEKRRVLHGSIAEKAKEGEDAAESTIRGIQEELGISITPENVGEVDIIQEEKPTPTYPGLNSKYNIKKVHVDLPQDKYLPNDREVRLPSGEELQYAYKEEQATKTTYFGWIEVE